MRPLTRRVALGMGLGAAGTAALSACAYNQELGRSQLLVVDDATMVQSAAQAWRQQLQTQPISRDPAANERVIRVGSRIVQAAGLGNQRWEYAVFQNPDVNAFVLPGGRMGVNIGLIDLVRNDDQLAAVIGHEVGHIIAHHAAERYSQQALTNLALSGASAFGGGSQAGKAIASYGSIGAQYGILLPFSRRHELEADRIGVDLMQKAGYDPRQAVELWRMMAARGGAKGPPQFASTHPSDAERVQALEAYLRQRGWA
ncbi:MAG TPA: M48 family metallopeptidase [Caulobacteraceae bacterium]|nr:M48 family metallopeptidase [Caulobacteraceae bacterium]